MRERRPSSSTRARASFSPPPELPAEASVNSTRHDCLRILASADREQPFMIRLLDVEADVSAFDLAWSAHVATAVRVYKAVTPITAGGRATLRQAWEEQGFAIQHDLADHPAVENPVLEFLKAHKSLKFSGLWYRLEAWLEAQVGRIARRPAFLSASGTRPTTTHYDEYTSLALVLTGAKTFYIAPPDLVHRTGRGMVHESSANPHHPGTVREQAVLQGADGHAR